MKLSGKDLTEMSGLWFFYQMCLIFFFYLFSNFATSGEISGLIEVFLPANGRG